MSFIAKYNGQCHNEDCETGVIKEGQEVQYTSENLLVHVNCTPKESKLPPLCNSCWQYHNGECL
jgi:hypothetical protein